MNENDEKAWRLAMLACQLSIDFSCAFGPIADREAGFRDMVPREFLRDACELLAEAADTLNEIAAERDTGGVPADAH